MEAVSRRIYKSEIQDVDDRGIVVVAANAFGNEDAQGDISIKGSFQKTIQERFNRLKWYKNHNQAELLGVPREAMETDRHLVVTGKLNLNKQISKDIYEDYKLYASEGKSLEHSVGVIAVKRDSIDKRKVLEWKWLEYSTLTNWGANPDTPMLFIKSDAEIIQHVEFLEKALRVANYSDEKGKQIEQHILGLKALIADEPPQALGKDDKPPFDITKAINNTKIIR